MMEVEAKTIVAVLLLKWMSMKAVYRKMMKLFLMVSLAMPFHFLFFPPSFVYALTF